MSYHLHISGAVIEESPVPIPMFAFSVKQDIAPRGQKQLRSTNYVWRTPEDAEQAGRKYIEALKVAEAALIDYTVQVY